MEQQEYQTKFEENVLNTLDYSTQKIQQVRKKVMIIFCVMGVVFTTLLSMFLVDVNRMNHSKSVVFSTWGFKYCPPIDLQDEKIELSILEYLNDHQALHYDNEKWFASIKIFLTEEVTQDYYYHVYAWVVEESYYPKDEQILKGSGSSMPYLFDIERRGSDYIVVNSRIPRDGSLYSVDMRSMFPLSVRLAMAKMDFEEMFIDIKNQVQVYFSTK